MKKYFKYISYSILILIPIGFIIGFSKAWNSPPSIVAAGSTSVQPLLTSLGNEYSYADLTVQPGGSSLGLKVAAEGSKSLGTASKNPYFAVQEATIEKNGYTKEMWNANELKTVTIAWDGIGIVYKDSYSSDALVINEENINLIYETFSGYKSHSLNELFIGYGNDKKTLNNNIITPYARSGGSNASGTATSFLNESSLNINENGNWKEVKGILKNGSYVGNVITTNESNVESWNRFQIENKEASMIYLSLGFIQNNEKLIKEKGYKIANYYNKSMNVIASPITQDVSNKKYGWYSPLNVVFPIRLSNQTTKDFIWWLVNDDSVNNYDNKGLIQKMGYAPLTKEDKKKMFLNNELTKDNFFKSNDFALHQINGKEWYGVPKN